MRSRDARPTTTCEAQTTCGACTPILGCGWCQYEDGTGSCATGPEGCRELAFRWNWEPTDCPVPAATDAGVTPADAAPGEDTTPVDSGAPDTAPVSTPDTSCAVRVGAPTTCTPTTGGTLCPSDRYTLGCHGDGAPNPTWGCAKAYGSGTETYYCCPCGG